MFNSLPGDWCGCMWCNEGIFSIPPVVRKSDKLAAVYNLNEVIFLRLYYLPGFLIWGDGDTLGNICGDDWARGEADGCALGDGFDCGLRFGGGERTLDIICCCIDIDWGVGGPITFCCCKLEMLK